jgi:hypothetical protein
VSIGEVRRSALFPSALANDQGNIIVLFMGAELLNLLDNRRNQRLWRPVAVRLERFDQALFAEFFIHIVE